MPLFLSFNNILANTTIFSVPLGQLWIIFTLIFEYLYIYFWWPKLNTIYQMTVSHWFLQQLCNCSPVFCLLHPHLVFCLLVLATADSTHCLLCWLIELPWQWNIEGIFEVLLFNVEITKVYTYIKLFDNDCWQFLLFLMTSSPLFCVFFNP